ncbi:MAG: radical SAM protein [Candidatus Omnitrophota bacterium]
MKEIDKFKFYSHLRSRSSHQPLIGQLELTYRCGLNCIHCYCKGSEDKEKELATRDWKQILDMLQKEGCVWLNLTGGDPLIRDDFLEIYSYAKAKCFIVSIFSSGYGFNCETIEYLVKIPPHSIEITLNGITQSTYESITQTKGSFFAAMRNIRLLASKNLPLIIKTNCIKQNRHELVRIKHFTEELLGKPYNKHFFRYDHTIHPRLNGDKTPLSYRLSFEEIAETKKEDKDIWQEYHKALKARTHSLPREADFLYQCNSWKRQFIIDPYGKLRLCTLSKKHNIDLKIVSFREGFYNILPGVLEERFKTPSKCRLCHLRSLCYNCPARAYLETGNEELPVEYFCQFAEQTYRYEKNEL